MLDAAVQMYSRLTATTTSMDAIAAEAQISADTVLRLKT